MTQRHTPIGYKKLDTVDVAERFVHFLNARGLKATYGELAAILDRPAHTQADILGQVNQRHKDRGGTGMITGCIIGKNSQTPSEGYDICAAQLGLRKTA